MLLSKIELAKMAQKYREKAEKAYRDYQETGMTKYQTAYRNADDLASCIAAAADAVEDKQLLLAIKCEVIWYAHLFEFAAEKSEDEELKGLVKNFASMAASYCGYQRRG